MTYPARGRLGCGGTEQAFADLDPTSADACVDVAPATCPMGAISPWYLLLPSFPFEFSPHRGFEPVTAAWLSCTLRKVTSVKDFFTPTSRLFDCA
jgi:hypothetical protein